MTGSAEIGLLIPAETPWDQAIGWGRRARDSGAKRLWASGDLAGLAVLSALARRLDLRVGAVVPVGGAPPAVVAKHLTSLDVVAEGRLDVAVEAGPGAGDVLAVLAGLAGGEPFGLEGPFPVAGARCLPPAVQRPGFPLWEARAAEGPPAAPEGPSAEPMGTPAGWWQAGLGSVEVTPWPT